MGIALLNPITGIIEKISYSKLSSITGKSHSQIAYYKNSKKNIDILNNYFVVDEEITYKEKKKYLQSYKPNIEIWKEINPKDFNIQNVTNNIKYFVSDLGRIKRIYNTKERLISQYTKKHRNTLHCKIYYKEIRVHKIVAMYFLTKPVNKNMVIYHIDGNTNNNDCSNLRWIKPENLGKITGGTNKRKAVLKIDIKTNEVLDFYESYSEAGRDNYLHRSTVRNAVNNKAIAGGFKWVLDNNSLAF